MNNLNEHALELAQDVGRLAYNDTEGDLDQAIKEAVAMYVEEDEGGLIAKVRDMRAAQKQYFKTRNFEVLNESKRLEREVDAMPAKMADPQGGLL